MTRIEKLEKLAEQKVYKFNQDFNLGSISYEVEIRDNSVRIYNEHEARFVNNQKELASWLKTTKKAFSTMVD